MVVTSEPSSSTTGKSTSQKAPATVTAGYQVPWVEKYRPRTLDDVVGNEETVLRLQAIAKDGNMPNLILCGPPGTGKTTSVHALARQLLGKAYKDGVLELNASDARGIDVRTFACLDSWGGKRQKSTPLSLEYRVSLAYRISCFFIRLFEIVSRALP